MSGVSETPSYHSERSEESRAAIESRHGSPGTALDSSSCVSSTLPDISGISGSPNSGRRSRSLRYCRRRKAFLAVGSGNSKTFNLLHRRLQQTLLMGYLDGTTGLLLEEDPLYGLAVALIEEAAGQQDEAQRKVCRYAVALLQLEGVDGEQFCYRDR